MGAVGGATTGLIDRRLVLDWYEPRRQAFPWRTHPHPYHVLVAEFMLQQTQVARVVPAHAAFLERFPSVEALAASPVAEVIRAWAGLGYNRRAVALWRTAGAVVERFRGRIPERPEDLRLLPGIGPYTSAAIASQAYGVPAAAVDVNVQRVVARALLASDPLEVTAAAIRDTASAWLDPDDPGAWNQALMDLGREHCRPVPSCSGCPLLRACASGAALLLETGRLAGRRAGAKAGSSGFEEASVSRGLSESSKSLRVHRSAGPARLGPEPFEGSFRQVRGRVVAALRAGAPITVGDLALAVGEPVERVVRAVGALVRDGIASADDAALAGDASGSVDLP
jgi:A/G-specific adenine glycosylase